MPLPNLRMSSTSPARIKNLIHGFQAVLIFLAWALTIAVFTKAGGIDGRSGWYFGICWLSIPALIYLVAVPTFPRARRFGNVYAFATVDALMIILWFSGWVAVASYVAEGKTKGQEAQKDSKDPKSGCDAFAYGSASKCSVSTATVIFGVVICLLFISTAYFSFRNVAYFRRTGTMPDAVSDPTFDAQTKAAFSSNPAHDFEEEDEFRLGRGGGGGGAGGEGPSHYGQDRDEDYALLQQSEADELGGSHHGGVSGAYDPTSTHGGSVMHDYDTSYNSGYTSRFEENTVPVIKMISVDIDSYIQYGLYLDPTTKAISLPNPEGQTPSQIEAINAELQQLNVLHRALVGLDSPNVPPPPLPVNPKRSAQITKLRDTANTAFRKSNYAEAVKLYGYAIDMAIGRPAWEPVNLIRDELSGLYANRAQAYMSQQSWPEGWIDSKCSAECKPMGNVKAWWRGGKCLVEMSRWDEARAWVEQALGLEGPASEGGKELVALLADIEAGSKRA
ncbi:hypothetical protein EYB25_000129 [Talaromyces marneffei]|nr:uncharacterized protein EYB26_002224 [Talaromyces marneffei]KAE8555433.1 hypothetical protein EYB25_000129 [Talaromyces marneffei]QGA14569.1 hypothetical protein EYB26_002224 [Talaromyces marneffei]